MSPSSPAEQAGVTKQALRTRIWRVLRERHAGRFPFPLEDRIPNFAGAERAARRLAETPEWQRARRIKCNPDAAQRPVRLRALQEGKEVFVAVPRLAAERCFIRLDPARLRGRLTKAATIGGAAALGTAIVLDELPPIDLVIAGSVAVNSRGQRVGKGGGYSDLEFALARRGGAVGTRTPVATTVHELQIVSRSIPMTPHDVPLDLIVTPDRVLRPARRARKPRGIRWKELSDAQIAAMPVLQRLRSTPQRETT